MIQELRDKDGFHRDKACLNLFARIPDEVILRIFSYLSVPKLASMSLVSRDLRRIATDSSLWKSLAKKHYPFAPYGKVSAHDGKQAYIACVKAHRTPYSFFSQLSKHNRSVLCVGFWNNMVVSGSSDGQVWIHCIETGKKYKEIQVPKATSSAVMGNMMMSGLSGGNISLFDLEKDQPICTLSGHKGDVKQFVLSKNQLMSASFDGTVRIWDLQNRSCVSVLVLPQDEKDWIQSFCLTKTQVIGGSFKGRIYIWDKETARLTDCMKPSIEDSWIDCMVTYKNKLIGSLFNKNTVLIWDLEKKSKPPRVLKGSSGMISDFKVYNECLIAGTYSNQLLVWDLETERLLQTWDNGSLPFCVAAAGEYIATGSKDKRVRLFKKLTS